MSIRQSVGKGGANRTADVRYVQLLLNANLESNNLPTLKVDGLVGPRTIEAIENFQSRFQTADGRVDPGRQTITKLETEIQALSRQLKAYTVLAMALSYDPEIGQTSNAKLMTSMNAMLPPRNQGG